MQDKPTKRPFSPPSTRPRRSRTCTSDGSTTRAASRVPTEGRRGAPSDRTWQTCSPCSTYLPGAPTVLRLEGCDLAAFVMRAPHIALHVGSLETDAPVAGLRWKSLRPCSYAIGRQVSDLVFCTDENGLLVELEIVLDDGGRLVVGGGRPACEHDEEAMPQAV